MNDAIHTRYEPNAIETARQAAWRERDAFKTPAVTDEQTPIYIKPSAPFTSGNIHIGHVRSYSIGDAYARFRRARGDAVLFAFGFDAFGLTAELGAIAGGEPPSEWVDRRAEHMTGQLQRLGFSFEWERSFLSSDPIMYRWSQWLFLTLLEAGLIYRGTANVDWCDTCQTTLASIQVEPGGTCWRCHGPVRLIQPPQWFLRISSYTEENDRRLAELAAGGKWDDVAVASQEIVLGRVDGALVRPPQPGLGAADRLHAARGRARGRALRAHVPPPPRGGRMGVGARRERAVRAAAIRRLGAQFREAETIPVIDTGRVLSVPGGSTLPVLVLPPVDSRFGPTVVFGVPSHDRTDEVIARRLGFNPREDAGERDSSGGAAAASGANGDRRQDSAPAKQGARPAVRYRAYDFTISRQRSWGTPIPIVYCEQCGAVPVPREQLPVLLPLDLRPKGTGNPPAQLKESAQRTSCPSRRRAGAPRDRHARLPLRLDLGGYGHPGGGLPRGARGLARGGESSR